MIILYSLYFKDPHSVESDVKSRSEVLRDIKSLFEKLIPLILAHNGTHSLVLGNTHVIQLDRLLGLKCTSLQRNEELITLNLTLIERLHVDIFIKVFINTLT